MKNKIISFEKHKTKKQAHELVSDIMDNIQLPIENGDDHIESEFEKYYSIYDVIESFSEELDYMKEFDQIHSYEMSINDNKEINIKVIPVKSVNNIKLDIKVGNTEQEK